MIFRVAKHFVVVGLVFALAMGWIATLVVNTALGSGIEAIGGKSATDSYGFALGLTLVSLTLIAGAIAIGSRVFNARFKQARLGRTERIASSLLFLTVVIAFVAPELRGMLGRFMTRMSDTYEHPRESWMMLSLPLLRLLVLPGAYFVFAGRCGRDRGSEPGA